MEQNKKIIARASFVHSSPRKLRLIADAVRKMALQEAITRLTLLPHRGAKDLLKVYKQATGNAVSQQISPASLVVTKLMVEDGPMGPKKADVHSHGARFNRGVRRKRLAHIYLELTTVTK